MIKCRTCNQKGATLGCHHSACRHSYHLSCARESKCLLMVCPRSCQFLTCSCGCGEPACVSRAEWMQMPTVAEWSCMSQHAVEDIITMQYSTAHIYVDVGSQGKGEEEPYMVACPTHTQTLLARLPQSEWPSTLPDGTSLPSKFPCKLHEGPSTQQPCQAWCACTVLLAFSESETSLIALQAAMHVELWQPQCSLLHQHKQLFCTASSVAC